MSYIRLRKVPSRADVFNIFNDENNVVGNIILWGGEWEFRIFGSPWVEAYSFNNAALKAQKELINDRKQSNRTPVE